MTAERIAGRRPQVTVLFVDLTGFTAMSERMDPEAATDLVNGCFSVMEAAIEACGGVVDRYIGDCVVSVWDLSDAATAARQASRAACVIREAVRQFNQVAGSPAPLDVHCGIASGPLMAGHVGGVLTGSFGVIGEPVVLAQALEEASSGGQVYIDAVTAELAGKAIDARALAPLAVAGHAESVTAFELCGLSEGAAGVEASVSEALARGAAAEQAAHERAAHHPTRGSERRQATMVFAEVAGFEHVSRAMTPERFLQLLNRCFTALEPAVHTHGGVIDKYVSERVLALFGVPNAIEHAPRQALNAVIDMRRRLRRFLEEQGLLNRLHLHVGVNTGLVVAGEMGGLATRAFSVLGDAVNVAARLKSAAPDDAVYVGRETHRHTRDEFEFEELPPLVLKGKEQPVETWRLLSESRAQRARTADSERTLGSALVGRERELRAIGGAVEQLVRGRGSIVAVVGDAGVGKSRLTAEILALPALQQVQVLEGRALSIGQQLSFHPFVDLLRQWAGIGEDDSTRDASAKLAHAVRDLLPDSFDDVFPFVARLTGLRVSEEAAERLRAIDGEALEGLIFKSVRELIEEIARQQPLLLVFEDLHWADQSSIKLLEGLLRVVVAEPVLILVAGRPDFADTLDRILAAARENHSTELLELHLQPLTDQQCDTLIRNLLKTDELPYATRALILRKAEGNPFFVEEVIRSFIDSGLVEHRNGQFHLTARIEAVDVPETIQEVVMARVDLLDEATRHVLQVAAVIGRSFYARVLAEVMDGGQELDDALARLTAKQLILQRQQRGTASVRRRVFFAEREYVFTHALAQEAIYESLLQRTRKELHLRVARSIETLFAERLVDFYGMLAYHFSRAETLDKAEEYLFKAGEEAARSAASNEALTFFREASRLYFQMHGDGGDVRRKAVLEKSIAVALLNTGALTESIDHFDRTLQYLGEPVPRGRAAIYTRFAVDLLAVLARLYIGARRQRRQISDTEREVFEVMFLRARALTTSDPRRLFIDNIGGARRLNRVDPTQVDGSCGLYAGVSALFAFTAFSFGVSKRCLTVAKPLIRTGNVRDEFVYGTFWFIHHYLQGHWGNEHAIDDALVEDALRAGQLWDVNTYVGLLCDRKLRQGDFYAARELVTRLAEISDAYGYGFAATNHDAMTTLLLLEQRQLAGALEVADAYAGARHEKPLKILGLGSKAKAQVLLGELSDAAATLAAADEVLRGAPDTAPWHLSAYFTARLRWEVCALRNGGERRRAQQSAREAMRVASKVAIQRTEIYQLCGRLAWLLGRRRQAERCWRAALQAGEQMGARPELARTYAEIGRSLSENGDGVTIDGLTAATCTERARLLFDELGLDWDRQQISVPAVRAA